MTCQHHLDHPTCKPLCRESEPRLAQPPPSVSKLRSQLPKLCIAGDGMVDSFLSVGPLMIVRIRSLSVYM